MRPLVRQVYISGLRLHVVVHTHDQQLRLSILVKIYPSLGRGNRDHRRQPDDPHTTRPSLRRSDEDIFETVSEEVRSNAVCPHLQLVPLLRLCGFGRVHHASVLEQHIETSFFGEELLGGGPDGTEVR